MSKGIWGTPCWYFFHGIAAKINEEYYKKNVIKCFRMFYLICNNLPCPYCKHHAVEYMKKTNIKSVNTKGKLINYFYDFHNHANENAGKDKVPKSVLEKYNRINMVVSWNLMERNFFNRAFFSLQFNNWRRKDVKKVIKEWLINDWKEMFK